MISRIEVHVKKLIYLKCVFPREVFIKTDQCEIVLITKYAFHKGHTPVNSNSFSIPSGKTLLVVVNF